MNKLKHLTQILLLLVALQVNAISNYEPNTVIIKVKPSYYNQCKQNGIELDVLNNLFLRIGASNIQKIFPNHKPIGIDVKSKNSNLVDLSGIYQIKYTSSIALEKVTKMLINSKVLEYAEPSYIYDIAYTPNDSLIAQQFYHSNMQNFAAWDISVGDTNTVIGISDSGFDTSHVDLKNSFKKNYTDPLNGIDDDNDGYVDNYWGWDFGGNDNDPNPDPCAVCNHGVHVAGISSATADNTIGIAGTGFKCKFMALKIMNAAGQLVNGYQSIVYAADHNCKIVNCSWGGTSGGQFGQDIVNYATYNKNCLVIAAAGNYSNSNMFFPAAYQNVLCVAATDVNDVKWTNSNYGIYVDVCAPGKDILSTWPGNVYVPSSGTSMACPAVAGSAAIVASYFPNYTALQIAERIKNTCNNIDTIGSNQTFANQLGNGRVNLLKALTDVELPALVTSSKNITDGNDNAFVSGDTITIKCNFRNLLAPTSNLKAVLRSDDNFITIIDSVVNLGAIATLTDTSNFTQPFKFVINSNCPQNYDVLLALKFIDGSYNALEQFYVRTNVDYINLLENDLGITITSRGLLGYNSFGANDGIGVDYNNNGTMFYEGGLMIGTSNSKVSDCIRSTPGDSDNDFVSEQKIYKTIPSTIADAELNGVFNDNGASSSINVQVQHQTLAWSTTGNENFVVLKYIIKNKNSTPINSIYAGVFADWDIMNYNKNRTRFLPNQKLSYAYSNEPNTLYAAIKLLSNTPLTHYALDLVSGGAGAVNLSDGFADSEKYTTLSTSRDSAGFTTAQGNDIADVLSTGPLSINDNDSIEIAFAIIGGNSEQQIIDGALAAQLKYDGIITDSFAYRGKNNVAIYPNPSNGNCWVHTSNFAEGKSQLLIFDSYGKEVFNTQLSGKKQNIQITNLPNGLYVFKVIVDGVSSYSKHIIQRVK